MDIVEAVRAVVLGDRAALYVSSLGSTTSALRLVTGDGPHLYLGGSMGSAIAVALGVADRCRDRAVVGLIGDGELLMGAGSLWSVAGIAPANLLLVVLANGRYGITGGQELIEDAHAADVANAIPPLCAATVADSRSLTRAVRELTRPGVIEARIVESTWERPSPFVNPTLVRERFLAASTAAVGGPGTSDERGLDRPV